MQHKCEYSRPPRTRPRYSRGLWAPRSIGLSTKIRLWQTLVRTILLYAAEAHAWQPRDVETVEKWENRVHYDTLQELLFLCLGSARKTFEGGLECTRSRLRCKFGDCSCAKKWLREGTIPMDKRTGAGEAMRAMVFGRLQTGTGTTFALCSSVSGGP